MDDRREKTGIDLGLTEDEKVQLHRFVKETIRNKLYGNRLSGLKTDSKNLNQERGAFVSLHKRGRLRGCIGHIRGDRPLKDTIKDMAIAAAFEDPRFPSLTKEEFNELEIEISILTPFEKINDVNKIEVGKHGIYITKEFHAGLLLPQVATEHNWDRMTFLEQTCAKAGAPPAMPGKIRTSISIFFQRIYSKKNVAGFVLRVACSDARTPNPKPLTRNP